eukprot:gene16867-biopygen18828
MHELDTCGINTEMLQHLTYKQGGAGCQVAPPPWTYVRAFGAGRRRVFPMFCTYCPEPTCDNFLYAYITVSGTSPPRERGVASGERLAAAAGEGGGGGERQWAAGGGLLLQRAAAGDGGWR